MTTPRDRAAAPSLGAPAAVLLVLLTLGLLGPATAGAHAIVVESTPAPDAQLATAPAQLVLRFNGRIETQLSRITLAAAGDRPRVVPIPPAASRDAAAPDRIVAPLPPLGPGRHVVRYKVLSADGHITEGVLRFSVGAAP